MSFEQDKIFTLKGKAQHYAWGGFNYIPDWLGVENKDNKPYAEYWMGAHPSASSILIDSDKTELSLYQAIQQNPQAYIGRKVFEQFGELPYLFKILDVKDMLSIQVHPSKTEAVKGFDAEEAAGVPLSAPNRNYKDKNHKPEVMVALSDEFWLLHGFLGKEALLDVILNTPEFGGFDDVFNLHGYKGLYQYVMELPQQEVNSLLAPLVERELKAKEEGKLQKHQPGWWVSKLYHGQDFTDIDRGVFSIYFFNIVKALPGEAIFQGAGMPHAYLEGQNVELMANSDNVLRGGLTPKHVDVPELVKHTIFEETVVNIMGGEKNAAGETVYNCPVPDFGLSKIALTAGQEIKGAASSLEIIVVMDGGLQVAGTNTVHALKGSAIAILPGEEYTITTAGSVLAYKAFVPQGN